MQKQPRLYPLSFILFFVPIAACFAFCLGLGLGAHLQDNLNHPRIPAQHLLNTHPQPQPGNNHYAVILNVVKDLS